MHICSCWEKKRNPLHFYTLTMKDQEEKLRKQSHLPSQQKQKIPSNTPT